MLVLGRSAVIALRSLARMTSSFFLIRLSLSPHSHITIPHAAIRHHEYRVKCSPLLQIERRVRMANLA